MIEKTFTVVIVESAMDGVFIYLKPQQLPVSPSTFLEPAPRSEDEKVAAGIVKTMMLEVKKTLGEIPGPPPPLSPFILRLYLTTEEYEKLGKPTVNDTIKMQLETQKEG